MAASILSSPELFSGLERILCTAGGCVVMEPKYSASIYSIALIRETINAMRIPKIPMKANENLKLDSSAM